MAPTNGYCTLAQYKTLYNVQGTDASRDTEIENVITAVSRLIDGYCHRRFYANSSDEVRYFTALNPDFLEPGDIVSITSLLTDVDGSRNYATTWLTTDYDLTPYNAVLDGRPYTRIELSPLGLTCFPLWIKGVKITGKFGYGATAPAVVVQSCLLQSYRAFLRKGAPFGIAGGGDMGQSIVLPKLDPDIELMLGIVRRL
jgi:hypothetical protein